MLNLKLLANSKGIHVIANFPKSSMAELNPESLAALKDG